MITFEDKQWAFVYWYFNHEGISVWEDHANPVIPSISTLRYFSPLADIYVIDVSNKECDWGDYPQQFRFNVVRAKSVYSDLHQESEHLGPVSLYLLSKTNDCYNFCNSLPHEYIAVLDSDLFFTKSPFPFKGSGTKHFWMSRFGNTGFYYYHKSAVDFIYLWRGLNLFGAHEEEFRRRVSELTKYEEIQEEAICIYALNQYGGCNISRYPLTENYMMECYYKPHEAKLAWDAKILHMIGRNCPDNDSLKVANSIVELRKVFQAQFTEDQYSQFPECDEKASFKKPEEMRKIIKSQF